MSPKPITIAFDLYGTILSTSSVFSELAKLFGKDAAGVISALWRRYQLEYIWRLNSMGIYRSFSECTRAALRHAVAEQGSPQKLSQWDEDQLMKAFDLLYALLEIPDDLRLLNDGAVAEQGLPQKLSQWVEDQLMKAYDSLHAFPEIPDALRLLKDGAVEAYVFSNGTQEMVTSSLESSPDLNTNNLFKGVVTVEDPKVFKPAGRVYEHLLEKVGKKGRAGDVWLVTANPFDVVGARAAGLNAAWVDRDGTGWIDGLGELLELKPTIIAGGVDELVKRILERRDA